METDYRFRAPTLLHAYESSSDLFLGQKLCGGTAGRQPPVLIVEGGTGENAETEESWTESPTTSQPCLTTDQQLTQCHTFHRISDSFKITPQVQHYYQAVWNSPESTLVYPFWFQLLHVNNPQIQSANRRILYCCTSALTTFCSPQNWLRSDIFNAFPCCLCIFPCD